MVEEKEKQKHEFASEITPIQEPFLVDKKFTIDGKVYARYEIEALIRTCYRDIAHIQVKLNPHAKTRMVSKRYPVFLLNFTDLYNRTSSKVDVEELVEGADDVAFERDQIKVIRIAKKYIKYLEDKLGFHQIEPQYRASIRM